MELSLLLLTFELIILLLICVYMLLQKLIKLGQLNRVSDIELWSMYYNFKKEFNIK